MTPQRFAQVQELYHAARERTGAERDALLAQIDPELRREVESLLAQQISGDFLDRAAVQNAPELLENSVADELAAGACLGPYRIEGKLGEGGMGEVFRAVDTRLGRFVAIKVLHERFSARFEQEARAISALNHPHICTLYDVGPNYLVMELIEGETLGAQLKAGRLATKTALSYASQVASALAEAHGKGIVHCDLKPGNIMIAKSGIKVLDFGLARSAGDEKITASHTVLGTPAYMAPEQREGKPADARTDIYAFGCVLYEMLTGGRIGSQRKRIGSRWLERIIDRCLDEDPGRRWQSAAELDRELGKASASNRRRYAVAAAALLAIGAGTYFSLHHSPKLTDKDALIVADFDNKTGDPVFDDTLRQGLMIELQQSPFLSLISDRKVQSSLALMGQPKGAPLTFETAAQVCERTASTAVIEGSISRIGSLYVLGLQARNCTTGNVLDREQAATERREDVLNSLSRVGRKLRSRLGETQATLEKHSTPLPQATTPSLEALKAYSMGLKLNFTSGMAASLPFLQRAVEIDPKFAVVHAFLGLMYSVIGENAASTASTTKAWKLRDRVSDPERFFIDFTYDRQVTGNLEKTYQTLESWLQTYPHQEEPNAQSLMGGLATHGTGRYERAMQAAQADIAADPGFLYGYTNLAFANFCTDRIEEAKNVLQRAAEHKVDLPEFLVFRYNIAFLQDDRTEMERTAILARGKRGAESAVAHAEAMYLARSGRLREAGPASSRAVDSALRFGDHEAAASYQASRAVWEAIYGNAVEAKKNALAALSVSHGRDVTYAAGLALGLSGDAARSQLFADDLEKRFPEDTFAKFTYVPVLRALMGLEHSKPAEALDCLNTALRYETAVNGLNFNRFYLGGLHSAYLRGEALLALHRYAEAAAEYQKIFAHRGLVGMDPIGVLKHWRLGRAYALSGDKAKAKLEYESFLAIWKDADRQIPALRQAKAEYAKL